MSVTLFDILRLTARELPGAFFTGTVDGAVSDRISWWDAAIGGADNSVRFGTVLWTRAAQASNQGLSRVITAYDAKRTGGDGYVTMDSAMPADITAGDKYVIIRPRYTRDFIVELFNGEYTTLWVPRSDTTLSVLANTKSYALPDGVLSDTLLRVAVAQATAEPYDWRPTTYFTVERGAAVSDPTTLRFFEMQDTGKLIRLSYAARPTALATDTDLLEPSVNKELMAVMTARACLQWRHDKFTTPPQRETNALNALLRREARMWRLMPRLESPSVRLTYPGRPARFASMRRMGE